MERHQLKLLQIINQGLAQMISERTLRMEVEGLFEHI